MEVEDCGGGVILIAWQSNNKTLNQQKEGCQNKSLSPKESATLPPLRLEEVTSHQQVLRRQEASVRDRLHGHPVRGGRVPHHRCGRRGQDPGTCLLPTPSGFSSSSCWKCQGTRY